MRDQIFHEIKKLGLMIGIGKVSPRMIDKINIGVANLLAMRKAVEALPMVPDHLLIDGKRNVPDLPIPQTTIIGGDDKFACIAAASVIAKVTRDRIMLRYHLRYNEYGFDRHKGYGTREHMKKLALLGPTPIHRRSFAPLSQS